MPGEVERVLWWTEGRQWEFCRLGGLRGRGSEVFPLDGRVGDDEESIPGTVAQWMRMNGGSRQGLADQSLEIVLNHIWYLNNFNDYFLNMNKHSSRFF